MKYGKCIFCLHDLNQAIWDDGSYDYINYCPNKDCKYKFVSDETSVLVFYLNDKCFQWYDNYLKIDELKIDIDQPNIYRNIDSFIDFIGKIYLNLELM